MLPKINSIKLLLHKVQITLKVLYKEANNTFKLRIKNKNKKLLRLIYRSLKICGQSLKI